MHCTLETTLSVIWNILAWDTLYQHVQEQKSTLVSFKEAVEVQCRTLWCITSTSYLENGAHIQQSFRLSQSLLLHFSAPSHIFQYKNVFIYIAAIQGEIRLLGTCNHQEHYALERFFHSTVSILDLYTQHLLHDTANKDKAAEFDWRWKKRSLWLCNQLSWGWVDKTPTLCTHLWFCVDERPTDHEWGYTIQTSSLWFGRQMKFMLR